MATICCLFTAILHVVGYCCSTTAVCLTSWVRRYWLNAPRPRPAGCMVSAPAPAAPRTPWGRLVPASAFLPELPLSPPSESGPLLRVRCRTGARPEKEIRWRKIARTTTDKAIGGQKGERPCSCHKAVCHQHTSYLRTTARQHRPSPRRRLRLAGSRQNATMFEHGSMHCCSDISKPCGGVGVA